MKKLLVLLVSVCWAALVTAGTGDNEFVAFSLKGKVTYKNAEKDNNWTDVQTKTPFYKGGVIKIEKGAELVLLHKEHKTIKLATAGTYKIDKLIKDAEKQPKDESAAYLEFIWKEFNKHHENAESYHREYMKTKGGVDREGCSRPLMLSPGHEEKVVGETITLTWEKDITTSEYTVVFYQDEYEDMKLLQLDIKGESLTIAANTFWIRPGKKIFWVVYPKGNSNCARYTFNILSDEEAGKFFNTVETEWNSSDKKPLDAIKAATALEREGYMEAAGKYYYLAMEISGFLPEYKILYSSWLSRAGKLEEAKKWWV